uniref:Mitochondrial import receptor subunit TOM40 n=1 Tax=Trypanosoma congolense (strain IL3000) TaxID=1068625 RepID=G0UPU8_TRYCI|nr:conserved hypothetical protein [Trypanosoma congolense IL3000]
MFSFLRKHWESGENAYLIEELISCAFSDFAPYAGAEQRQTRLVRRQADGTTTKIACEESGNWFVSVGNPYIGGLSFSTVGDFLCDLQLRLPLQRGNDVESSTKRQATSGGTSGLPFEEKSLVPVTVPYDSRNPFRYSVPPPRGPPGCCGMAEVLYSHMTGNFGVGARFGPFSLRATLAPSGSSAIDNSRMSEMNHASCVVDGSYCMPVASIASYIPSLQNLIAPGNRLTNEIANHHNRRSAYNVTVALQHPFMAVEGDTLLAFCVESSKPDKSHDDTHEDLRFLVVQTLASGNKAEKLQNSDFLSRSRSTIFQPDTNWSELGTLIGIQKSFDSKRFRLSAAAMFHDNEVDYEAAAMADVSSFFPKPAVVRLGFNKACRVAFGITSKVIDGLTMSLGVHYLEGTMRFGLEAFI